MFKRCPFCGNDNKDPNYEVVMSWSPCNDFSRLYSVVCKKCGVCTDDFDTEEAAVEAWDKRYYDFIEKSRGKWQKDLIKKIIQELCISHEDAMKVIGLLCEEKQIAYIQGYNKGYDEVSDK